MPPTPDPHQKISADHVDFFPESPAADTPKGMTKRDADVRLRLLLEEHSRAVARCLAYYGVATADQQDIAQEVFLSAHSQLLRDNHPSLDSAAVVWRSWLRQIARRQAANYRRKARPVAALLSEMRDPSAPEPERIAAKRELLVLLLDTLDPESREIFLDVNAEGMSWQEISHERSISIDRARYLHSRAASSMDKALARWEKGERALVAVPLSVAELLAAAPPVHEIPEELHRRIRDAIDRHTHAAARPRELSRWGRMLSHAGVLVLGGVLGWLLHGPPNDRSPAPLPSSPGNTSAVVAEATAPATREISPLEAPVATTAIRPLPAVAHPLIAPERKAPDPSEDEHLLDQAQAALNAGDAHAALAALSTRDGHFGGRPSASVRLRLLVRACALAGAAADRECAGAAPAAP
jgi:RNA polymerase sigma factor (sigma-70 family)